MDEIVQLLDKLETAIKNREKSTVKSILEKFENIDTFDEPVPAHLNSRAERLVEKANDLLNG